MYVNGEWRESSNQEKRTIINPANGKGIAYAPEGTIEDTKYAIEVARATFDSGIWSEASTAERASYLFKIADEIDKNMEELVYLETMDNGKTYREAEGDIGDASGLFSLLCWIDYKARWANISCSRSNASNGCKRASWCLWINCSMELSAIDECMENCTCFSSLEIQLCLNLLK